MEEVKLSGGERCMGQRNANTVEGEEGVKLLGYSQCVHGRVGV